MESVRISKAAKRIGCCRASLYNWCTAGLIEGAYREPGPQGSWRVPQSWVDANTPQARASKPGQGGE